MPARPGGSELAKTSTRQRTAKREGWLYLAVLLDLFSCRVVGWAAGEANDRKLALRALERAVHSRKPGPGLTHHTDRGSPYASVGLPRRILRCIVASMSRTGNCYDSEYMAVCYGTAA